MNVGNWISVAAIIVSLGIAVWSTHQTHVAANLASRPYISIYPEAIDTVYFSKYLVVKNFGKTGATIKNIEFDKINEENPDSKNITIGLSGLVGGTIGPSQKLTMSIDDRYNSPITISVTYTDYNGKSYNQTFEIKTDMMARMLWSSRMTTSNEPAEATAIKNAAAGIMKSIK